MKHKILYLALAGLLILTACGNSDTTPTQELNAIQTQAFATISAAQTQTALAAPKTPTAKPTELPTFAPATTSAAITLPAVTQPAATVQATASCYGLRFVSDVTIPDNTQIVPGQSFTKTWKVLNAGSCAWDAGFKFTFVGGEQMSGATFTLPSSVAANAQYDISIPMVAPTNKTGSLRGNWRMQTAGGTYFGDEVYVLIVVGGATPTNTSVPPTATTQPSYP